MRADGRSGRSNSACSPGRNAGEETDRVGWCGFMGGLAGSQKTRERTASGCSSIATRRRKGSAVVPVRSERHFGQLYKTKLYGSIIMRPSLGVNTKPGSSSACGDDALPPPDPCHPATPRSMRRRRGALAGAAPAAPADSCSAFAVRPIDSRSCTPSGNAALRDREGRHSRQIGSRPGNGYPRCRPQPQAQSNRMSLKSSCALPPPKL